MISHILANGGANGTNLDPIFDVKNPTCILESDWLSYSVHFASADWSFLAELVPTRKFVTNPVLFLTREFPEGARQGAR